MSQFTLSAAQRDVLEVLIRLIGLSGVHKRPEQGDAMVLDLLPAEHVITPWGVADPFCLKVEEDGRMQIITDAEAGLTERPDPLTAMRERIDDMNRRRGT